jgi:hypothetical protein
MQNVYKDTYIAPKVIDNQLQPFININTIKPNKEVLNNYFEDAEEVQQGSMLTRIYVKCNNPLSDYKKNSKFNKCLSQEKIILEEIILNSVNPTTLGFLELLIPDPDNLRLHTVRIRKYLPEDHPKFQLFSKTLYDSRHRGTRVVMIKCDKENYEQLDSMFNQLHQEKTLKYFPWKEFTSFNDEVRDIAFQKIFNFNKYFRSVRLEGFRDNEDNIPMKFKLRQTGQVETNARKDPLENMLVSDYIGTIQSGNKTPLFNHVYEPIGGVWDTLVHTDNYTEAKEFAKVVLIELAREMSLVTRTMVLREPAEVKAAMADKPKWKPFTKADELLKEKQSNEALSTKRPRTETSTKPPYPGWRNLGGGIPNNNQNKGSSTPSIKITDQAPPQGPTWEQIQRHVEEQIGTTTSILRTEIQLVQDNTTDRMDELDRKLDNYSTSTDTKLDAINKQGDTTVETMSNRFNRLEDMFAAPLGNKQNPTNSVQNDMEFQLTRDELMLKRKAEVNKNHQYCSQLVDNKENQAINLLNTQPDIICDGNAAKMVRK